MSEIIEGESTVIEEPVVTIKDLLNPARATNESFEMYKQRRATANKVVAGALKNGKNVYDVNAHNRKPYVKG